MEGDALAVFDQAAASVCADLARAIAADAEGASHLVTIDVEGLRDDAEARKVAKAVADSALVKTAIFGGEGLFLATLTGPGRVVLQSMTLQKLRRELAPMRTGGDSHGAFDALSGFLGGSED